MPLPALRGYAGVGSEKIVDFLEKTFYILFLMRMLVLIATVALVPAEAAMISPVAQIYTTEPVRLSPPPPTREDGPQFIAPKELLFDDAPASIPPPVVPPVVVEEDAEPVEDVPFVQSKEEPVSDDGFHIVDDPQEEEPDDRVDEQKLYRLTLEQLPAFSEQRETTVEEQRKKLMEGFLITETQSNRLTNLQRTIVLDQVIRTKEQLMLFARALLESDQALRKIEVEGPLVRFSSRTEGTFLGFIPVSFIVETTVDLEEGEFTLTKPWWTVAVHSAHSAYEDALKEALERTPDTPSLLTLTLKPLMQRYTETMLLLRDVSLVLQGE